MAEKTPGRRHDPREDPRKKAAVGRVPPPARPQPGVQGTPPLPVGKAVTVDRRGVRRPVSFTDMERRVLEKAIGWKEGDPVPENMADLLAGYQDQLGLESQRAVRDARHDLPLPVAPDTPPVQVTTVQMKDLPPDQRAALQDKVGQALQAEQARRDQAREQARRAQLPKGVQEALEATDAAAGQRRINLRPEPSPEIDIDVDDDLALYDRVVPTTEKEKVFAPPQRPMKPAPTPAPVPTPTKEAKPSIDEQMDAQLQQMLVEDGVLAPPLEKEDSPERGPSATEFEAAQEPAGNDMGADQAMSHCPHCSWPLDVPDVPEPGHAEKMAFLHSVLGQTSFTREYSVFGGAVKINFRTLTTEELDAVFWVAYGERRDGVLANDLEFIERVNRLRLALEVRSVRSSEFQYDLPDGLSAATNPYAGSFWSATSVVPEEPAGPGDHGVRQIYDWIQANVIRTESFNRIIAMQAQRFHRLVARLEAMVDDENFWQATGE